MPNSGLSPLVLPRLLCSGCGKEMEIQELLPDAPKPRLAWSRGHTVHASCHGCHTTFEVALQHSSARNMIYQPVPLSEEETEELPEVS